MTQVGPNSNLRSEPYVLEYRYKRSTGPIIGRFLEGLKDCHVLGVRASDGKIIVPPTEYDPRTAAALEDMVEVGSAGTVETWCWVDTPREGQPLDRPFAWALVRLDGADTSILHAVDAGESSRMQAGLRVRVRWREERIGWINDIECFELETAP